MYTPGSFTETRPEVLHALIHDHPFATLVVCGRDGPEADHLPLLLSADGRCLHGHVARANPVWRGLGEGTPALAIFHGPHAYVSPSWYPSKQEHGRVVPTWNYAVVHARGRLRAVDDPGWLHAFLDRLTDRQEATLPRPWRVADAPEVHTRRLLTAIVGIELVLSGLQGKWKVSQNQPERNRHGVAQGLRARGGDGDAAMAALVEAFAPEEPH
jgi:transcriptional regulator